MKANSIFLIDPLGQNWIAETFDRIDRGAAKEIGNDKRRISEIPQNFFRSLARAIELARNGEVYYRSNISSSNEKKVALLVNGGLLIITLTKKTGQLRGWIDGCRIQFNEDGTHVDGYDAKGIFDVVGDYAQVKELAETYLTGKMRRFEDDKYVVWV